MKVKGKTYKSGTYFTLPPWEPSIVIDSGVVFVVKIDGNGDPVLTIERKPKRETENGNG